MANLKRSISKRLRTLADAIGGPQRVAPSQEVLPPTVCAEPLPTSSQATPQLALPLVLGRFINAPLQHIEVDASPEILQRLVDMTAKTWTKLGEEHAHWSVLSWPEFLTGEIDEERFFKTGADDFSVL